MMLQFAIAGLLTCAQVIVAERKSRCLQRLLTTATSRVEILLGHYLSIFALVFTQFIILIVFGQLVLKLDYLAPAAGHAAGGRHLGAVHRRAGAADRRLRQKRRTGDHLLPDPHVRLCPGWAGPGCRWKSPAQPSRPSGTSPRWPGPWTASRASCSAGLTCTGCCSPPASARVRSAVLRPGGVALQV